MELTAILQLITALTPSIGNVIMLFKNANGSSTVLVSSAQTATENDISQMQAWLQAHQAQTQAAAPATQQAH